MLTISYDPGRYHATNGPVHRKHVHVYAAKLGVEIGTDGAARRNIGLHHVPNDLDRILVLEERWVDVRLSDDLVPLFRK